MFKNRQAEVKQIIGDKFKEWRKQLRAAEMKVIDQLYANYAPFEEKYVQAQNANKRMIGEAQAWMEKAKQALDEYSTKTQTN